MATKLSFDWKFDKTGYPRYLNRKARLFQVVGEIKDPKSDSDHLTTDDLLVEKGYIVGDDVYIYKGEATNIDDVLSRDGMAKINEFYLFTFNDESSAKTKATDTLSIILTDTVDGTNTHGMALFLLIKSYDENEREAFKAVHTAKADLDAINDELEGDVDLYDPDIVCNINASTAKFAPPIDEKDDFLKKLVKCLIHVTGTDVNKFKSVKDEKYWLTNLKTALTGSTKMSTTNFRVWSELMHSNFAVIAYPEKSKGNVPYVPLIYNSENDEIYMCENVPGVEFDGKATHIGDFLNSVYDNCPKVTVVAKNGSQAELVNMKDLEESDESYEE